MIRFEKMTDTEQDKWFESKDLNNGFFAYEFINHNYNVDEICQSNVIHYIKYKKPFKMGCLNARDIKDFSLSYLDYLISEDFFEISDTLIVSELKYSKSDENTVQFIEFETTLNVDFNRFSTLKKDSLPIVQYLPIYKSDKIEKMQKYFTFSYGYFDETATLNEIEKFMDTVMIDSVTVFEDSKENDNEEFVFEENILEEDFNLLEVVKFSKLKGYTHKYL